MRESNLDTETVGWRAEWWRPVAVKVAPGVDNQNDDDDNSDDGDNSEDDYTKNLGHLGEGLYSFSPQSSSNKIYILQMLRKLFVLFWNWVAYLMHTFLLVFYVKINLSDKFYLLRNALSTVVSGCCEAISLLWVNLFKSYFFHTFSFFVVFCT